eukprot:TRINITY_DN107086_c0_g1_i1.p1 TRINITY_DN107086_c0_g1~~TRINITY_DN107086_c0_g1_i1.p1  ORF type:complete len:123 (+),score=7.99 TRINITY_DN107086_c0_g1_i1:65-433(+)
MRAFVLFVGFSLLALVAAKDCLWSTTPFTDSSCATRNGKTVHSVYPASMCWATGSTSAMMANDCTSAKFYNNTKCQGTAAYTVVADNTCYQLATTKAYFKTAASASKLVATGILTVFALLVW